MAVTREELNLPNDVALERMLTDDELDEYDEDEAEERRAIRGDMDFEAHRC